MATRLATYRTQADVTRSRKIAQQRKTSNAPLAKFRTEAAAYRAGYSERDLMRSPFGRDLIERARHTRQQRRATQRNQSYNYVVGYQSGNETKNVTVRSDRRLSKREVYEQAQEYFYRHSADYGNDIAVGQAITSRMQVVGEYRGAIMRQPLRGR